MRLENKLHKNYHKNFFKIFPILIFSIFLFVFAAVYNDLFTEIMSVASYLTWHSIFEFAAILFCFSIFTTTFFIYEESRSLSMIILSCSFLAMGILDFFHTLSFKGMADFFIVNDSANRATTLWILSRTIGNAGFLTAIFIPREKICNIRKRFFVIITTITIFALFLIITYFPNFFPAMYIEGQGLTPIKIIMEYIIIILMSIIYIKLTFLYNKNNTKLEYNFMIAILFLIFSEFAFISYASVYDAYNYIGHIYKFIAYGILYKAIYVQNVSVPYREMKKAKNELKEYSDNLNYIVKQRTKELEEINEILMTDIAYAKEMQHLLLPVNMPQDNNIAFVAKYLPAEHLSGDFYNVIKIDENNIAIYIGDVSGHGVSAAMLTMFANQNIKTIKEEDDHIIEPEIIEPGFVLKNLYKAFNKTNFKTETYIVMLYGIYNIQNKTFTYSSAGINVPPLIINNLGEVIELDIKGFPICKLGEYYMPFFDDRIIQLNSGDKIVFYTDGLVENKGINENFNSFSLKEYLTLNHSLSCIELEKVIERNLFNYRGSHNILTDDITLLIMEIK